MKFSYLKTSFNILITCLVLGSSLVGPAYSYGLWGNDDSSSSSTASTATATNTTAPVTATLLAPSNSTDDSFSNDSQSGGDFWPQLRRSFNLDHYTYTKPVQEQIAWFRNHPQWLSRTLTRAAPYMYYVYSQVEKRNLPGELVLLPVIESAYNPFAYSDRGAAGLWQLMPGTASGYGLKQDWWYDGRRDIFASTNAALDYLTYLQNFFNGNWLYAIASYDAGQGTIQNAINYNAERDRETDFWDLPLPSETNAYVPQLLALAAVIADPHEFGITLPNLQDGPYFAEVNVGTQINLATAAKMADISLDALYKLNPGYNRWATDPNGPSLLLLPVDKIDIFKQNLASLPLQPMLAWNSYEVKAGESLGSIADEFGTHIALLQEMNKLNSNILHTGQVILVPKQTSSLAAASHLAPTVNTKGQPSIVVDVNVGDSLWSLAVKYQVQPAQILQWNHLAANTPLHVGQKLVIFVAPHPSIALHPSMPAAMTTTTGVPSTYKVTSGDTLDGIAKKFGTTGEAIAKLNHLGNSMLQLGEELKLPASTSKTTSTTTAANTKTAVVAPTKQNQTATVASKTATKQAIVAQTKPAVTASSAVIAKQTPASAKPKAATAPTQAQSSVIHYAVKSGDTLSTIAKANHVRIEDLQRWNRGYLGKYLRLGQVLVIYK